jgi:hypothetical protein
MDMDSNNVKVARVLMAIDVILFIFGWSTLKKRGGG